MLKSKKATKNTLNTQDHNALKRNMQNETTKRSNEARYSQFAGSMVVPFFMNLFPMTIRVIWNERTKRKIYGREFICPPVSPGSRDGAEVVCMKKDYVSRVLLW